MYSHSINLQHFLERFHLLLLSSEFSLSCLLEKPTQTLTVHWKHTLESSMGPRRQSQHTIFPVSFLFYMIVSLNRIEIFSSLQEKSQKVFFKKVLSELEISECRWLRLYKFLSVSNEASTTLFPTKVLKCWRKIWKVQNHKNTSLYPFFKQPKERGGKIVSNSISIAFEVWTLNNVAN